MPSSELLTTDHHRGDIALPVNPFVSNRYHFGMLLGVADLDVATGYPRGKMWLHNGWLHGPGVVWGLKVEVRADRNEVVVERGLAIDHHGRELWVADAMCLDLGQWFAERRPDDLEVDDLGQGVVGFRIHVALCLRPCLDRPVPSISEPCDEADLDTAYSRSVERAVPMLVAGAAPPDTEADRYPRLRRFFGQVPVTDAVTDTDPDVDADVQAAFAAMEDASDEDRYRVAVEWFRRLAAEDTMALAPEDDAHWWSPAAGDGCITLADLDVRLRKEGDGYIVLDDDEVGTKVDNQVRPSHVRTRTIQELLCHPCTRGERRGPGPAPSGEGPPPDHGPRPDDDFPRVVHESARLTRRTLVLRFTQTLDAATVSREAFQVATLRDDGWALVDIERAELEEDARVEVSLRLRSVPRARPLRIIAFGSGIAPLVGANGRPLSGVDIDNQTVRGGADAVLMMTTPGSPAPNQ